MQHAELHLGRQFTKEEFVQGLVGSLMIPEDFDIEKAVRIHSPDLHHYRDVTLDPVLHLDLVKSFNISSFFKNTCFRDKLNSHPTLMRGF